MPTHHRIDYLELPAKSMADSKAFYHAVFGWTYTDYGDAYSSFKEGEGTAHPGLDGGITTQTTPRANPHGSSVGGPLVVFYSDTLEATRDAITDAGGTIVKPIFSFPGGRRFHFTDPAGNELAVWGPPQTEA